MAERIEQRDPTIAFLLEFVPGLVVHWFGWGHIYAGRVLKGLFVMFLYWILQGINVLLTFVLIGWVTMALTWFLFLLFSSLGARRAAESVG